MKKAYRAAWVIDGVSEQPLRDRMLLLEDGQILGLVGPGELPSDAAVIDLGACTILPGLIDSHVHLVDDGSARPRGLVETESAGMTLLRSTQRARQSLRAGVTSLRDMGAPEGVIPTLRDAIRAGVADGPTILTCDTQLTITGGYGRRENVLGREVDGADGMRLAVRRLIKNGADFVKLMASGQVSNAGAGLEAAQFTDEEMAAAVQEAHRLGYRVAVHAVGLRSIEASVSAGVDCIEHGNFMTEVLASEMARRGIGFVPTLLPYHVLAHPPPELLLSADVRRKAAVAWEHSLQALQLARSAGLLIGAGTDSGGPCIAHNAVAKEIGLLVEAGLSVMEAIRCATANNARILGLHDVGTLEPGKTADVIAVEGDLAGDLGALARVQLVIKGGRHIPGTGMSASRPPDQGRYLSQVTAFSCGC